MSVPKYARKPTIIDPRLSFPPWIEGVKIDDNADLYISDSAIAANNYYGNVVRDERGTQTPILTPGKTDPVTSGVNPWGVAKIVSQELIINPDGKLMAEVTFELPDWGPGYEERVVTV